jgi:hypothetical protein
MSFALPTEPSAVNYTDLLSHDELIVSQTFQYQIIVSNSAGQNAVLSNFVYPIYFIGAGGSGGGGNGTVSSGGGDGASVEQGKSHGPYNYLEDGAPPKNTIL